MAVGTELALVITDMEWNNYTFRYDSAQMEALQDENSGYGWSDNGGDPDGNAWLIWGVDLSSDDAKKAIALGAQPVTAYTADYAPEPWKDQMIQFASGEGWSGIGSDGYALFLSKADAELCQRTHDEWMKDNDIDTIAHRVHAIYA